MSVLFYSAFRMLSQSTPVQLACSLIDSWSFWDSNLSTTSNKPITLPARNWNWNQNGSWNLPPQFFHLYHIFYFQKLACFKWPDLVLLSSSDVSPSQLYLKLTSFSWGSNCPLCMHKKLKFLWLHKLIRQETRVFKEFWILIKNIAFKYFS